jgi:hypothetical protein
MKSSKIEWRTVEILSLGSPSKRTEKEEELSPMIKMHKSEAQKAIKEEQEESEH